MSLSIDVQKTQSSVPVTQYDAVVMGAGPYGLSTAAHLKGQGLKVAIFGKPLELWRDHMPKGMLLRSYWWASNLSDPHKKYDLPHYFAAQGQHTAEPFPIETFIDYGLWFQTHAVPDVDETYISTIERQEDHFLVKLVDGRELQTPAVVMAPGLRYYVHRPEEYTHMPAELVSHTADHVALDKFSGKQVVVIGGGQSALEMAALLNENGAEVHVVMRSPLRWLSGDSMDNRTLINKLRHPKAGIAPGWFNWGLEYFPYTFQHLPRSAKDRLLRGRASFGPAGSHWLKERILGKVTLHELQCVQEIKEVDNAAMLTLSNNTKLKADHVILGTGYRIDVKRLPMLDASLVSSLQTYQGAPILSNRFETNIPGLYFVGFSTLSSCGPLFRFVVGTEATARRVAGAVARQVTSAK